MAGRKNFHQQNSPLSWTARKKTAAAISSDKEKKKQYLEWIKTISEIAIAIAIAQEEYGSVFKTLDPEMVSIIFCSLLKYTRKSNTTVGN